MLSSKIRTAITSVVMVAVSSSPAFAIDNPLQFGSVSELLGGVFNAILGLVGALALILLSLGGIQYMTSGGDKIAVEQARGRITAAVVGLLVGFGAGLVINFIGTMLPGN